MDSTEGDFELMRLVYATRHVKQGSGKRLRACLNKKVATFYGGTMQNTNVTEGCRWHWYENVLKRLGNQQDALTKMHAFEDLPNRELVLFKFLFSDVHNQEPVHLRSKSGQLGRKSDMLPANAPVIKQLLF